MRYLGGKFRQSRQIVAAVADLHPEFTIYVEPFCGAMWSACAVMRAFPNRRYILSDANPWLIHMWKEAIAGWNPPATVTEAKYHDYKARKPLDDPMTAYIGFGYSFGGKWYGGPARDVNDKSKLKDACVASTNKKIDTLRQNARKLRILKQDFRKLKIPDGAMVYLDPPYVGRTKRGSDVNFCDLDYEAWARDLATRCTVIATDFKHRDGWKILHNWGDTVVRHHSSKGSDGTCELLMQVLP